MPLIENSTFRPPRWLRGAHSQTFWPTLFRRPGAVEAQRIDIPTPDDDSVEADWWRGDSPAPRVLVLSHGLEGSSRSKYIIGLARTMRRAGWDALAWNYRGCGFKPNRQFRAYHSGDTSDLRTVIAWAAARYETIALAGFSVGGNVTLRYLGEAPADVDPKVVRAIAFSVPCDLGASARRLDEPGNGVYLSRFLRSLKGKVRAKIRQFPGRLDPARLDESRDFVAFDEHFTAPMFGFAGAEDYYARASVRAGARVPSACPRCSSPRPTIPSSPRSASRVPRPRQIPGSRWRRPHAAATLASWTSATASAATGPSGARSNGWTPARNRSFRGVDRRTPRAPSTATGSRSFPAAGGLGLARRVNLARHPRLIFPPLATRL